MTVRNRKTKTRIYVAERFYTWNKGEKTDRNSQRALSRAGGRISMNEDITIIDCIIDDYRYKRV